MFRGVKYSGKLDKCVKVKNLNQNLLLYEKRYGKDSVRTFPKTPAEKIYQNTLVLAP